MTPSRTKRLKWIREAADELRVTLDCWWDDHKHEYNEKAHTDDVRRLNYLVRLARQAPTRRPR